MTGSGPQIDDAGRRALNDLDLAYGHDYDLAVARSRWMACGLETGRWLVASCASELRRLITADAAPDSGSVYVTAIPSAGLQDR